MEERFDEAHMVAITEKEHYSILGFTHNRTETVELVFVLRKQIKPIVSVLRLLQTVASKNESSHNIVVSETKPTYSASKLLEDSGIEHFVYTDLLFPVILHSMVPPHRLMTEGETVEKLRSIGVRREQLPRIKRSDPVAKFYNFPAGAVIEIHRRNGLQQRSLFYRLVSPA